MEQQEIISRIKQPLEYMKERKETLFNRMELAKQKLENLNGEIGEQETYLKLENQREKQESNIFSLYDTANRHEEEKQRLSGRLEQLQAEKDSCERLLDAMQTEFAQVNQAIISSQILLKEMEERQDRAHNGDESRPLDKQVDIMNVLKLCLELLELDKERCRLELKKLIEEAEKTEIG